jgi:acyl-CoA thioesterase FadM
VAVWLSQVGRATATFRYELWDADGAVLASGETRLGCLDSAGRPVALPADVHAGLERGMKPDSPASDQS